MESLETATRLELHVGCRDLKRLHMVDYYNPPNPLVVLYCQILQTSSYQEMGRSEIIKNSSNPDFLFSFSLDYSFGECQKLKFEVYDVENKQVKLDEQDMLGFMECNVGEIVSALSSKLRRPLCSKNKGKSNGHIIVSAEESSGGNDMVCLHFSAAGLDKKDFMGKSDPYLVLLKRTDSGWVPVYKTEVVRKTLNPSWRPLSLPVRTLCNFDYNRMLKIECYDWERDGKHALIGAFTSTLNELMMCSRGRKSFECINESKKGKKNYKNSGIITLFRCSITPRHSFLDYIRGGCQIGFTVAIDFTASNGRPSLPTSLHYINPYEPNPYCMALQTIVEIIQDYATDKMFPALGFGAKVLPSTEVSHEFFLNGDICNPYCNGIDGLLEAYRNTMKRVRFDGPTNFASVINHVARFAGKQRSSGLGYFILLIMTDGVISDLEETKAAIVRASGLPMSIIIIGIGDADFTAMTVLDADVVRLESNGKFAERDIVQFVPFRNFVSKQRGRDAVVGSAQLARFVLAEVPDQFLQYMYAHAIEPKVPVTNSTS
ncbi:copine-8-like [Corticium candelabrum]|uniref:copine-8-like n=1 Tax=Corticium candelabrum TaxID=121492 RepID=UPI002E2764F6|nr:copine-8-like [Corticium candelabrum]